MVDAASVVSSKEDLVPSTMMHNNKSAHNIEAQQVEVRSNIKCPSILPILKRNSLKFHFKNEIKCGILRVHFLKKI